MKVQRAATENKIAQLKLLSQTKDWRVRVNWHVEALQQEWGSEGKRKEQWRWHGSWDSQMEKEEEAKDGVKVCRIMEWGERKIVCCVLSQTRSNVWQKLHLIHSDCRAERMLSPQREKESERDAGRNNKRQTVKNWCGGDVNSLQAIISKLVYLVLGWPEAFSRHVNIRIHFYHVLHSENPFVILPFTRKHYTLFSFNIWHRTFL